MSLAVLEVLIQHDLDMYHLREALQGFNVYLARRPDDLYALLGRGVVWERFLSFADAVVDYRRAVAVHPESDRARRRLAAALLIAGTPSEALEQYQRWRKSSRLTRRSSSDWQNAIVNSIGRKKLACSSTASWHRLWITSNLPRLTRRSSGSADRSRWTAADRPKRNRGCERTDKAAPFDRRIVFSLFNCLQALEKRAEAEAVNRRIEQIDADLRRLEVVRQRVMSRPKDIDSRIEGAKIFLRNGERDEGIRWLELALRFDPSRDDARAASVRSAVVALIQAGPCP